MHKYRTKGQDLQSGHQAHVRGGRFSLRRLWRDDSGTTAIEFGFCALGLVYLMVGIIEFSMAMTVGNSLEAATNLSSRLGKTGFVDEEAQLDQEETIMDEVERRVGPMIDMDKLEITHEVYNDFESLSNPDNLQDVCCALDEEGNQPCRTATPTIRANGRMSTAMASKMVATASAPAAKSSSTGSRILGRSLRRLSATFVGDDGIIDLMAYSVVKNEPY